MLFRAQAPASLSRQQTGQRAESLACRWLAKRGIRVIERNYLCAPHGEIDIIGREGDVLLFVEVRYRRKAGFVRTADTLSHAKIQRLLAAIDHYLQRRGIDPGQRWRLDALGMTGPLERPVWCWLRDISP